MSDKARREGRVAIDKDRRDMERKLMETLGELGGAAWKEEDIKFQGREMVLPQGMSLGQAIRFLQSKKEQEEETATFSRTFRYRPWDGAFCTWNALKKAFGAVGHPTQTVMGFFGPEKIPPQLITINIGPDEQIEVPWGALTLPFMPKVMLNLHMTMDKEMGPLFAIVAEGPRKYRHQVEGIFKLIEDELRNFSMYKGKAIDGQDDAEFLDLSGVDPNRVVYTDHVTEQLNVNVWSPLLYSDKSRELDLPLKRSVLVYGPYGTGKTLAAFLTAQKAVENDWTFVYARPGRDDLGYVMQTAKLYQPAVVFFEDMDTVASTDQDSDEMTRILDTFDGITAKGTEIMVILTTNHPERIHKGMVRPGRLDACIEIAALDQGGIENMIKANVDHDMLASNLDFDAIGEAMRDFLPAFVREASDRTVRYALTRSLGKMDKVTLTTEDFVSAANGLRPQLDLMTEASDVKDRDRAEEVLKGIVKNAMDDHLVPQVLANGNH